MKLDFVKGIGFGVVIYAVAFVVASGFIAFNMEGIIPWVVTTAATVVAAYFLAGKLGIKDATEAMLYGAIWVIVLLALDYLITVRFTGMDFFSDWKIWIGYALVLLTPIVATSMAQQKK